MAFEAIAQGTFAPVVSVVIPVYNGAQYLRESVESVLGQTVRDLEILIVDDGSTDETWQVIEAYMAAHPGVVRGIRKANGGTATALNTGIRAATGKYFAWLSHDDRFAPDKLEKQLDLLKQHPAAVGVYSDVTYINADGARVGRVYAPCYPPHMMLRYLLQDMFINGSTLMIERRCLIETGLFDEAFRYSHDSMLWVHLLMRYQLVHVPEPLTEYRVHPNQTSNTAKKRALRRDTEKWLRAALQQYSVQQIFPELDAPGASASAVAQAYFYYGQVFLLHRNYIKLALEQYRRAWQCWPHPHNPVLTHAPRTLLSFGALYWRKLQRKFSNGTASRYSLDHPVVKDLRVAHIQPKVTGV